MDTYRISELASRTGIPPSTLRFYEQAGLLPAHRTASNYRVYGEAAVARLEFIVGAKLLGLPLEERVASGTGVRVYRRIMGTSDVDLTESWAPRSCTLPTVERPLRVAEFDQLFAHAVERVERVEPGRVRLEFEPTAEIAARAADLAVRETGCCSFFTFTLTATAGALHLEVSVPGGQVDVLDALAARADAAIAGTPA